MKAGHKYGTVLQSIGMYTLVVNIHYSTTMRQLSPPIYAALILTCCFPAKLSQGFPMPTNKFQHHRITTNSVTSRRIPAPSFLFMKSPSNDSTSSESSSSSHENPLIQANPQNKPRRCKKTTSKRRRLVKELPYKQSHAMAIAKGRDPLLSLNMNLDYLAKSGRAAHAEELLVKIEKLFAEGYYAIRPDSVSYNSVLNAYMLNSDSPEYDSIQEVQRLLARMK